MSCAEVYLIEKMDNFVVIKKLLNYVLLNINWNSIEYGFFSKMVVCDTK